MPADAARAAAAPPPAPAEAASAPGASSAPSGDAATVLALRQALARLAHEIRNPLNAVRNAAGLLAEGGASPEEVREFAGIIRAEAQRLEASLTEILEYARPARLRTEWASLPGLVGPLCDFYARAFAAHGVALETSFEAGMPPLRLDPAAMSRIVSNLLVNARQAMPAGGRIRVVCRLGRFTPDLVEALPGAAHRRAGDPAGVRYVPTPDGAVPVRPGDPAAVLEIGDNGPGIPPETLGRVFEPFFTTKPEGTGLGLAVVRELASAHGGAALVRSSPEGTRFSIALPVPNQEGGERA